MSVNVDHNTLENTVTKVSVQVIIYQLVASIVHCVAIM